MAIRLEHPERAGVHAVCGFSHVEMSFYAKLSDNGSVVHHDAATTGRPVYLREVLDLLIRWEFFVADDVPLAHHQLQMKLPEEIEDPDTRRAAEVLEALKAEAND